MKNPLKQCNEIINAIREDSLYKENKCTPENFKQLEETHSTLCSESGPDENGNNHQTRIHLKNLRQARIDLETRKEYFTRLERIENIYYTLLEEKKEADKNGVLNHVYRQSFQTLQREKEKLTAALPFRENSENISHLFLCIKNYTAEFRRAARSISQLKDLVRPYDNEDITIHSALFKSLRLQLKTLLEKFRAGQFLSGGIDVTVNVFVSKVEAFAAEISEKKDAIANASAILDEKSAQLDKQSGDIELKLLHQYRNAAAKALRWTQKKKIYSAARAFESASIIAQTIDRQIQYRTYLQERINVFVVKDVDNHFKKTLETVEKHIKNNSFSKADKLLNGVSKQMSTEAGAKLDELTRFVNFYQQLRPLYIKHRLKLPGSSLANDIAKLRESIKKCDLPAAISAEYGILDKMSSLRIRNLENLSLVETETITFKGTAVPFSAIILETPAGKERVISDDQGRFQFKEIPLMEGKNTFQVYDESVFLFTGKKNEFSITREVPNPFEGLTEYFTGVPVEDFPLEELVRCQRSSAFLYAHALEEWMEKHAKGCPECGHDQFYTHKDKGFYRIEDNTIKIERDAPDSPVDS